MRINGINEPKMDILYYSQVYLDPGSRSRSRSRVGTNNLYLLTVYAYVRNFVLISVYSVSLCRRKTPILPFFELRHFVVHNYRVLLSNGIKIVSVLQRLHGETGRTNSDVQKRNEQIIIIIIRKLITRTCSQALSMNRRCGQSLSGLTVCINC